MKHINKLEDNIKIEGVFEGAETKIMKQNLKEKPDTQANVSIRSAVWMFL
jgi:hypothetical protein